MRKTPQNSNSCYKLKKKNLIGLINCQSVCQNAFHLNSEQLGFCFVYVFAFIYFLYCSEFKSHNLANASFKLFVQASSHQKSSEGKNSAYNGSERSLCYQILNRQLCSPRHDQNHWWVLSAYPPEVSANGINGQWRMK